MLEYLNKALLETLDGVKTKAAETDKVMKFLPSFLPSFLEETIQLNIFNVFLIQPAEDINFRKHVDTVCSLLENFGMGRLHELCCVFYFLTWLYAPIFLLV